MSESGYIHNQGGIFDPIISLEAWRTKCDAENVGTVHVDITFREAYLGDEPESKVRFQASLKRAVVKIYVSKRDPIKVVKTSVDRGEIAKSTFETSEKSVAAFSAEAHVGLDTSTTPLKGGVNANAKATSERERTIKTAGVLGSHKVQQFVNQDMYCWEITPQSNSNLLGKIWDAVSEPRLGVTLTSTKANSADCDIRILVECRRQDIEIRNVQLKERKLSIAALRENNLATAEAVLKQLIFEKGFNVENFDEPFSSVVITSMPISEE